MSEKDTINLSEKIHQLQNLLKYLLKKWLLILTISIGGVVIGVLTSIYKRPTYETSLSFVVEGESGGKGLASIASSLFGQGSTSQGMFNSANILDLLKSRSLIQKTLLQPLGKNSTKSYADLYIEINEWDKNWEKDLKLKKLHFKPETNPNKLTLIQNGILDQIYRTIIAGELQIEIKNPENTIIYIDIKSSNEEFSVQFPKELIKVVSEFYIESKTRKAKINYQAIKTQTDSVRNELNNAIVGVASANDNTFLLNPAFNIKRVPSAHKEVSVQANQAILTELVKNLEVSRMNLLNETPFIEIIDLPTSPIVPKKLGKIKASIIGGFIAGLLIISYLIGTLYLKKILKK